MMKIENEEIKLGPIFILGFFTDRGNQFIGRAEEDESLQDKNECAFTFPIKKFAGFEIRSTLLT